jgi:cytosine/adenosine deaminase-related metal-dependent hydrolase
MRILIKNGTVIDTSPSVTVSANTDVLIDGERIEAVGPGLPEDCAEVVDATGMLVLPGFVDSHRHTWQAAYRAIVADDDLETYFRVVLGELAPAMTPEAAHAANLAGARECLDSGVTTLLDWTHLTRTPEHTDAVALALHASGIRAVLGYCPTGWDTDARRARDTHVHGLLTMAIAALGPEIAGEEQALEEWRLARELDLPVTVHLGLTSPERTRRTMEFMRSNGLFDRPITHIHAIHYSDDDFKRVADTGGSVSISPAGEQILGMGHPPTGRAAAAGAPVSFSADTVTCGPGDMFSLMRAAYTLERGLGNGAFTTRDVLRMATIGGARTVGLGDVTGSLTPGKQADLILLRTDTPGMSGLQDPVGGVVLNADTSTVDTVLVAGQYRKRGGRLL